MTNTYYPNQIEAANGLYEYLYRDLVSTALLSAEPQAGKTGAAMCLFEKIYDSEEFTHILMLGPSNRALRQQTHDRLKQSSKVFTRLIGNKVWHTGELYAQGPTRQTLIDILDAAIANNERILVVWDEAHIGAGTTNKQTKWQKVPAFFDKMFGGIPGTAANKGISFLVITATPFAVDLYIDENPYADYGEVFLKAGPNYQGIRELHKAGRIKPNVSRNRVPRQEKAAEDRRYNQEIVKHMKKYKTLYNDDNPKYLIFRGTGRRDLAVYETAAKLLGIPFKTFLSKEGTIKEFEKILTTPPQVTQVLIICRSYKEGQTLCQDHIGTWYGNDTVKGRTHADQLQDIGRCFGNFDPKNVPTYPIHCDMPSVQVMIDYIDACYRNDFADKRKHPTTQTHKKVKCVEKDEREFEVYPSRQAAEYGYTKREGQNQGRFITKHVSRNAHDVISELKNGTRRQKEIGRVNIIYFDGPSPEFQQSWDDNPHLHHKWAILYDTGKKINVYDFKCSDMYNKK